MRLKGQKRRIQGKKAKAHRVVILCAEGKQKAHTAVVIPSYAEKGSASWFLYAELVILSPHRKQAPHTREGITTSGPSCLLKNTEG